MVLSFIIVQNRQWVAHAQHPNVRITDQLGIGAKRAWQSGTLHTV